jgi:hypothetical protein
VKDEFGNEVQHEWRKDGNKLIHTETFVLEEGKTTLRGKFPKFKDKGCPFPDRLDCNSGAGYRRCEFMKFVSLGNWKCSYGEK